MKKHTQGKRAAGGNVMVWVLSGVTGFCLLGLVFSYFDVRRKQRMAAEPPPIYTGETYGPVVETETMWENLHPQESEEFDEALKQGDT